MATFNDGGMALGTQTVTIATIAFVADNIQITRPTVLVESFTGQGAANKEAIVEKNSTGTMTLQALSSSTAAPARGAAFTLIPAGGGAAINFKITEVGETYGIDEETKFAVSFRGKIN